MKKTSAALLAAGMIVSSAHGQSAADSVGIRTAALDYIEGWSSGGADRMERALHPDLAKRIIVRGPDGQAGPLRDMSASVLIESTRRGGGSQTPPAQRRADVRIFDNLASARIDAGEWIDYIHLIRSGDRWQIVHVLLELRAASRQRPSRQ